MFWIYGGGFLSGMATELSFGADHLISRDVIVVEANYRVGPFGKKTELNTKISDNPFIFFHKVSLPPGMKSFLEMQVSKTKC